MWSQNNVTLNGSVQNNGEQKRWAFACAQGRIKGGGATEVIAPVLPLEGGPGDDNYLFQIKYSFEKLLKLRSDTRIQIYIRMLH